MSQLINFVNNMDNTSSCAIKTIASISTSIHKKDIFDIKYDPSNWKVYEETLSIGRQKALRLLSEKVIQICSGKNIVTDEQEWMPRSFPQGYENIRKNEDFRKLIGINSSFKNKQTNEKSSNNKTTKLSREDRLNEMKMQNSINRFTEENKSFTPLDYKTLPFSGSSVIEMTIVKIISHLNSFITNKKKSIEEKDLYEVFFGIGKLIHHLEKIIVRNDTTNKDTEFSSIALDDLKLKYSEFSQIFSFNYTIASNKYPRLYYSTKYDNILPGMSIKPYEAQCQILDFVNKNINNGFMCVLNTLMGMGKTTLVTAISEMVYLKDSSKTVIYCCPEVLDPVRKNVCQNANGTTLPFAVAFIDEKQHLVIKEHNSCKNSTSKPKLIIAGVIATVKLLEKTYITNEKTIYDAKCRTDIKVKHSYDPSNFVLFFDENTYSLDNDESPMIQQLAKIYQYLPPCTIFASATHPNIEEIPELANYIKTKFTDVSFMTVSKSKVLIGTQINKMNGQMFIPHSKCSNPEELDRFINIINNNLLFKKSYTLPLVCEMYNTLCQMKITIPENLKYDKYMDNYGHRNQDSIQNLAIEYLKIVSNLSGIVIDIVKQFCDKTYINTSIDLSNLFEVSKILNGQTFISCNNPEDLMFHYFKEHFETTLRSMKFKSFQDIVNNYKKMIDENEKKKILLQKLKNQLIIPKKLIEMIDFVWNVNKLKVLNLQLFLLNFFWVLVLRYNHFLWILLIGIMYLLMI